METKRSDWSPARHPVRTKRIHPLLPRRGKGASARGECAEGDEAFGSRARETPNPIETHPPVASPPSWRRRSEPRRPFGSGQTSRNPHGRQACLDLRTRKLPPTVPTAGCAQPPSPLVDGVVACPWPSLRMLVGEGRCLVGGAVVLSAGATGEDAAARRLRRPSPPGAPYPWVPEPPALASSSAQALLIRSAAVELSRSADPL